jgi:hypothetical protein
MGERVLPDKPKVVATQYNVVHYLFHFRSGHTILVILHSCKICVCLHANYGVRLITIKTKVFLAEAPRRNSVIRLECRVACEA